MNKLFETFLTKIIRREFERNGRKKISLKTIQKEIHKRTIALYHIMQDSIFIILGTVSASFALNAFLLPNSFIDGGVTGISLILNELSDIPFSLLLIGINIPFVLIGYSTIGKNFAIKSILAIVFLSIIVHLIHFPAITQDKLLISVFGWFFLGLGIGLSIRWGAVIDGTEVLAIFINKKSFLTIGDVILIFNIIIFAFASYVFSIETGMYAMLTYLSASKTVDFVVSGLQEYVGATIISEHSEEIRISLQESLGRKCIVYSGKNPDEGNILWSKKTDIVYLVLSRLEIAKLNTEVDKIDEEASIITTSIKEIRGNISQKNMSSEQEHN